ncbi:DNA damage-binding protein 2 [Aplysia californica]|uniref:DNA damage-binding protein 2 n=1 Tax=Aplysia californica TaxID=6500 RepID=A0ABM1A809_APLCA|nr:DNA damage-binding protein 2 [Aplysia californica]
MTRRSSRRVPGKTDDAPCKTDDAPCSSETVFVTSLPKNAVASNTPRSRSVGGQNMKTRKQKDETEGCVSGSGETRRLSRRSGGKKGGKESKSVVSTECNTCVETSSNQGDAAQRLQTSGYDANGNVMMPSSETSLKLKDSPDDFSLTFEDSKEKNPFSSLSVADVKPSYWPKVYDTSTNVFHYVNNLSMGRMCHFNRQAVEETYISSRLDSFEIVNGDQPFKTRVTTVDWHPKQTNLVTVGSKHGDVVFYRVGREDHSSYFEETGRLDGLGPGGSVSALKFHPEEEEKFYTASLSGRVCLWNAHTGREEREMFNTFSWENWFCSLDVHQREDLVVFGHSTGRVHLQSRGGETVWTKRLHKKKVTHAEFSPREPALLCTASLDHTVKMWDMRMIKETAPMACLLHDRGVNSAYFSLTDGCRLLTTDQFDDLRVYRAPLWHLETRIKHPHRFFQHLTPIKAYWHPVKDLIVCGRFPDMTCFPELGPYRMVDIYDAATGRHRCEMKDVRHDKIVSLCKFNNTGDKLLTSMGFQVHLWSHQSLLEEDFASEKERDELARTYGGLWERSSGSTGRPKSGGSGRTGGGDGKKKRGNSDHDYDITALKKKAKAEASRKRNTKEGKESSGKGSKSSQGKKPAK